MRKHCSDVCKLRPCLNKESKNSARLCTIMTAALQWQYSQTELIFWISLVIFRVEWCISRPLIHLFLQMLKYILPYKCNCIMISNIFNILLTLKNRPIRWRTLYILQDLRFKQLCCWRFKSSRMLHSYSWVVTYPVTQNSIPGRWNHTLLVQRDETMIKSLWM